MKLAKARVTFVQQRFGKVDGTAAVRQGGRDKYDCCPDLEELAKLRAMFDTEVRQGVHAGGNGRRACRGDLNPYCCVCHAGVCWCGPVRPSLPPL